MVKLYREVFSMPDSTDFLLEELEETMRESFFQSEDEYNEGTRQAWRRLKPTKYKITITVEAEEDPPKEQ